MAINQYDQYQICINQLSLNVALGVYPDEQNAKQPVIVHLVLDVEKPPQMVRDRHQDVVCYHRLVEHIKTLEHGDHIQLIENLGEKILSIVMQQEAIKKAKLHLEK
ncbi:MAG: dihydroneopterin aldolase, partial [Pseudomonadota bacterium]